MRNPVVAGRFYPASQKELLTTIKSHMKEVEDQPPQSAIAVVVPHAGYIYSGLLAGQTLGSVTIPETVLLLGPSHTGQGHFVSLSTDNWSTPLGEVPVDQILADRLIASSGSIVVDESAHIFEHSLEVQIPFLQYLQTTLSIVPLIIKQISYDQCKELADSLFQAINKHKSPVLIVASTDMNHYESRAISDKKNGLALAAIKDMDPQALYSTVQKNNISMCGVVPVVIALLTSQMLGAKRANVVGYMDSGSISGDTKQVVGYTGVIIE